MESLLVARRAEKMAEQTVELSVELMALLMVAKKVDDSAVLMVVH